MRAFLEGHLHYLLAGGVVLASLLLGLATRRVVTSRLTLLASSTHSKADDALVESLRGPLPLWFVLGGMYFSQRLLALSPRASATLEKFLLAAVILSVTLWAANLGSRVLQVGIMARDQNATPITGVVRYVVKFAVLGVGGLVMLSTLGISITPVLTTVGIGGLAVALGLQETFANLFAGMQITLAGNLRVGDFIRLESGEEGYIEDIHWRATRVLTLRNNFVFIPNNRLAQSVITNYHKPSKDLAVLVEVGVHYSSDLDLVERVTVDTARTVMKTVEGGMPDFEPLVRFHTFADSSINLTAVLRATEMAASFAVKHAFVKALARAYNEAGIVIPFPIRAINTSQEQATGRGPSLAPADGTRLG